MPDSPYITVPEQITLAGVTFYFKFRDLLRPYTEQEQQELLDNIAKHGIKVDVVLVERDDGDYDVVDGINRLIAAMKLQIPLDEIPRRVEDLDEDAQEDIAISLNVIRRQFDPEQRRALVARLRQRGNSLRAIGDKIGVSPATVKRDLDAAGVSSETPDDATVTGKDGKQYPAVSPQTVNQRNAELILAMFEPGQRYTQNQVMEHTGLSRDAVIRACGLLHANGNILQQSDTQGVSYVLAPDEDEWREALLAALRDKSPQAASDLFLAAGSLGTLSAQRKLLEKMIDDGQVIQTGMSIYALAPTDRFRSARAQAKAAILQVLTEHGPLKCHVLSQHIDEQYGRMSPADFDLALKDLHREGAIQLRDDNAYALAPIDHIDPETAEVTQGTGEAAVTISPDEAQRIAEALPERQREFLIAVATGQPVVKNAATRIALVNRKLLHSAYGTDSQDWWDQLELTGRGIAVAAILVDDAASQEMDGGGTSPLSGLTGEEGQGGEVSDAILAMMIEHLPGRGPKHAISEPLLRMPVAKHLNRKITTLLLHLDALERDGKVCKNGLGLYYLPAEEGTESSPSEESEPEGEVRATVADDTFLACAADIARYLAEGPATRTTIREALGRPYTYDTFKKAVSYLITRGYVHDDPSGLRLSDAGRYAYIRPHAAEEGTESPLPASGEGPGVGSDGAEAPAPASDETPGEGTGDDDAQVADLMDQIVAYLTEHGQSHNHAIKSGIKASDRLIDRALYRLVKARRVFKSRDRWYKLLDADHELAHYLGEMANNAIKNVQRELQALPIDRLTPEQAAGLRDQAADVGDKLLALVADLEALDAALHDVQHAQEEPTT